MGKIKHLRINSYRQNMLCFEGRYIKYNNCGYLHRGFVYLNEINNCEAIDKMINDGYSKFVIFQNETHEYDTNYQTILNNCDIDETSRLIFRRYLSRQEVFENFRYSLSLQINGKRITDFYPLSRGRTRIDEDIITFIGYEGHEDGRFGKLGATADALFGPRYITESSYRINDDRCCEEYRKHISEIEKIILTKEFRDIEVIGTPNEFHLNGKKETIELDLRNPDMEVYEQIRAIDNCIEIIWE